MKYRKKINPEPITTISNTAGILLLSRHLFYLFIKIYFFKIFMSQLKKVIKTVIMSGVE